MKIDFSALYAPQPVAGIHVESSVLPALGWLPENGQPGQPAVNVNAAQNFSRGFPRVSRNWAVPTIGWIQQLLPLQDIWRFGYGQTRVPYGPYQGGEKANEQGGTEFGVNSSPMAIPQIGG